MKMLFRKSLIMFVQLSYGATINRKIRECIYWMLGDEQIAYYIGLLRDSFWRCTTGDESASMSSTTVERELREWKSKQRSNEEKLQTRKAANLKLIESIPGKLKSF